VLPADEIPIQPPGTFYVRVRIEQGRTVSTSGWIPIVLKQPISKADLVLPDVACDLFGIVTPPTNLFATDLGYSSGLIEEGSTVTVPHYAMPPDLSYFVRVCNKGQSSATVAVSFSSLNDGVKDIAMSPSVTVAAGAEQYLEDFESTRVTDWETNNNISIKVVLDVNNLVKEASETNNQCSLTYSVYLKQ
jgi:hypothetical protein